MPPEENSGCKLILGDSIVFLAKRSRRESVCFLPEDEMVSPGKDPSPSVGSSQACLSGRRIRGQTVD